MTALESEGMEWHESNSIYLLRPLSHYPHFIHDLK